MLGPARRRLVLPALLFVLALSLLAGLGVGAVAVSPWTALRLFAWKLHLASRPDGIATSTEVILFQLRMPRVVLAAVVGAGLATAGAVFQGLFRNPMADPAIIGVSSGAAMGAIVVIVAGQGAALAGLGVPIAAFAGSLAVAVLVYRLARLGPSVQVATLLLAGIAVAAVISAAITMVMAFSGEEIRRIYFWLLGGFGTSGWRSVVLSLPFVVVGAAAALRLGPDLNLAALGEERAGQLGLEVERFKRLMLAIGSLLTAAAVSVSGLIGFVGLMTPHILRLVVGADHRRLLPASMVGGAAFMVLADLAARTAVRPAEIPVGAVTALLGGPFFLFLLRRDRRSAGAAA
jgi:iron complex transport system permease protein